MPPRGWGAACLLALLGASPAIAQPALRVYVDAAECPSEAEVRHALEREGLAVVGEGAAYTLRVRRDGALHVEITSAPGEEESREIPAADEASCEAAADAVAVLALRRVQGLQWEGALPERMQLEAPPPPTSSPVPALSHARSGEATPALPPTELRLQLEVGATVARGLEGAGAELGPTISVGLRVEAWEVALSAGHLEGGDIEAAPGSVRAVRWPIALFVGFAPLEGPVDLVGHGVAELEVLTAKSMDLPRNEDRTSFALRAGLAITSTIEPIPRVRIRLRGSALAVIVGRDLVLDGTTTVARHAPFALAGTLFIGYSFSL